MSDEQVVNIEVDDELGIDEFPENDIVIDVLEEGQEGVNPEVEQMKAQLEKAEQEKLALAMQQQQNELLANTLKNINDNLKPSVEESDDDDNEPSSVDLKAIIDNVDKNLVLKPGETLMQALVPIVQELEKGYEKKLTKRDRELGKLSIYQNEDDKKIYTQYQKEVDTLAKNYSGTDAYRKAVKEVRLNHSEEIMQNELAGLKEQMLAELKQELGQGSNSGKQPQFTNANQNLNSGKKTISISKADLQTVKDWAFNAGGFFDLSDPGRMQTAIEMAKENGIIK